MHNSETIDLAITDVAHGGVFVGRHEGRVVFVPDTMPGESVRVRLTDTSRASYWRGEVVEVLEAAPERRPHVWAAADVARDPADRAGGADFGHIALDHQRALKHRVLVSALARTGGLSEWPEVRVEPVRPVLADGRAIDAEDADGLGWRTRVELHVDAAGRIGPFAARSHRVVEVEELPIAHPAIGETLASLAARPGEERIRLVVPADGRVRVRRAGDPPETIVERVGGREFRVSVDGFWQVHRLAAHTLTEVVGEAVDGLVDPDAVHLDLYGGVGLFAAALADRGARRVTTVEADAAATAFAAGNLAEWPGIAAETGRVDRWLGAMARTWTRERLDALTRGVVVLDPPRAGAGREVARRIAALRPAAIVYVACDPVALARDLKEFRGRGYELDSLRALDLFPHSHHVEAVARLRPAAS